jgi:hypothetical protein
LGQLSRAKIRKQFEKHFTARHMAQDYLAVYRSLAHLTAHLRLVADDNFILADALELRRGARTCLIPEEN